MLAMAAWHGAGVAAQATQKFEQVQGEVISEETRQVREGGRRSKHWVDRRFVEIQYDLRGETHSDEMRSDTLEVGETAEVWVKEGDNRNELSLDKPNAVDPFGFVWGGVWLLLGVLTLLGVLASIKRTRQIGQFDPTGREPDFMLTVTQTTGGSIGVGSDISKQRTNVFGTTITRTDSQPIPARLLLTGASTPQFEQFPQQLAGYYFTPPKEAGKPIDGWVVLYAQQQNVYFPAEALGSLATA